MSRFLTIAVLMLLMNPYVSFAQKSNPELLNETLSIEGIADIPNKSLRIEFNKTDSTLYLLTQSGDIYSVNLRRGFMQRLQTSSDHGLSDVQGLEISNDGTFYIVGNIKNGGAATNTAYIKRGTLTDDNWSWETVAYTDPYPLSNTAFDHIANAVVISPDGSTLYINSGSRTDHGEIHDVDGKYPGLRDAPLTAKILQVPADTTDALLANDLDELRSKGFIYAEGTRNSFSLAFDADGNLFGTENAGDRDDPEELNWLREGHHYGFPWVIGGNETPMQFEGFDPDNDPFIPKNSTAYNGGFFYEDSNYPAPPEDVVFSPGVINKGPDADTFRDAEDGQIKDASDLGLTLNSFTSHLSPMGLSFDVENQLPGDFEGEAFMLGFSGGSPGDAFLMSRMDYHGEDLIHLSFEKVDDNFEVTTTSLIRGFYNPSDTEIIGDKLYMIEFRDDNWLNAGTNTQLYEITFPGDGTSTEDLNLVTDFSLDQNYPNPFNPSTTIGYSLETSSQVILEVFNEVGQRVSILVNGRVNSGSHTVEFNAEKLASGVYFYKLSINGSAVQTKKMLLMK